MGSERKTNRRQFLRGQSAVEALQGLVDRGDSPAHAKPAATAKEAPADAPYLMQISRRAMATEFQVFLNAGQYPQGTEAALAALDLVERVEEQLTVYRPHSEVLHINRVAADGPVTVESRLWSLIQLGIRLHGETHGAFDITSGPLSKTWGFYRRQGQLPDDDALRQALACVGTQWLEIDDAAQTVRFLKRGVEINFNAVGKGYAIDRCGERLREADVADFLIHGGQSSVLAGGTRAGLADERGGWRVALRHPLRPTQRLAEIRLRDRALGTSSTAIQYFRHQGKRYGHILDPRTGWPADELLSATVIASTGALADALSTAFFVMGREPAEQYCREHPDIAALLVCRGERAGSTELVPLGLADDDWHRID